MINRRLFTSAAAAALGSAVLPGVAGARVTKTAIPGDARPLPMRSVGRTVASADGHRLQWPGVYFEGAFEGDTVYARFDDAGNVYHVTVDDRKPEIFIAPGRRDIAIDGLGTGPHQVRVDMVSEWQTAPSTFGGLFVPTGAAVLPAPSPKPRQIEFIGDSLVTGHGNVSPNFDCTLTQIRNYTDVTQAFGPVAARYFDADYQVNAASGLGMVRNGFGWKGPTVPQLYPFVLFDGQTPYDFDGWEPQVIVIMLGVNDFSTALNKDEKWPTRNALRGDFFATFSALLKGLRDMSPQSTLIVMETDTSGNSELFGLDEQVVKARIAAGDDKVVLLPLRVTGQRGCNGHPSATEHRLIAQMLIDYLKKHPDVWEGN